MLDANLVLGPGLPSTVTRPRQAVRVCVREQYLDVLESSLIRPPDDLQTRSHPRHLRL